MAILFSQNQPIAIKKENKEAFIIEGITKLASKRHLHLFLKDIKKVKKCAPDWINELELVLPN